MAVEMLESIIGAFYTLDAEWRFICINKAAEQYLLHSADELIGRSYWEVSPQMRGTGVDAAFQRAMADQAPVSLDDWYDSALDRWFDVRISPFAEGLAVSFHDVTARKQAREALRQCEERYRHIVETAQEGIWQIDAEDRTVYVNQKMAAMLGYTAAEMLGRPVYAFLDEKAHAQTRASLTRRRQGQAEQREVAYRRKDGTPLLVAASSSPIFDDGGRYVGSLAMLTDIADRKRAADELSLIADLRQAIARDELRLYYQPKVHLATGRVCGFEALVRWIHPTRGMIGPDQFIPLAEQTGLIAPLARWVLEAALRECRRHQALGLQSSVAVNLSAANLHDCELPGMVARLLQTYGVPAQHLRIEVTESILAEGTRAKDVLTQLAALGVAISVDDFGTGHSSLAYLKRLPVDELKIDKTFIQHMCEDETDVAIVASTIGLAHSLGLQIVAEGVEDQATWDLLVRLGCDVAQGYYFSRPMPMEQLTQWLRSAPWAAA